MMCHTYDLVELHHTSDNTSKNIMHLTFNERLIMPNTVYNALYLHCFYQNHRTNATVKPKLNQIMDISALNWIVSKHREGA